MIRITTKILTIAFVFVLILGLPGQALAALHNNSYLLLPQITITEEETDPHPDTPKEEWVKEWIDSPDFKDDDLIHFSYRVYENTAAKDDVKAKPFLLNSHKAMVRESHQRIVIGATGGFNHESGVEILQEDIDDFLDTDIEAYHKINGTQWQNGHGDLLTGFTFPTYWGDTEYLDPQWERETFVVTQTEQVDAIIDRYLQGAEDRQLSGDFRGTTLDLQVGASADDAYENDDGSSFSYTFTGHTVRADITASFRSNVGDRYPSVTVPNGATVDVLTSDYFIGSNSNNDPRLNIDLEDVDDADDFATTGDVTSRTTSGNSAFWSADNLTGFQFHTGTDFASAGTAVFGRAGWASGQAVVVLTKGSSAAPDDNFKVLFRPYDQDTSRASKLHIEYSEGGAAGDPGYAYWFSVSVVWIKTITPYLFRWMLLYPPRVP